MDRKKLVIGCGALAAVLVLGGVCWYLLKGRNSKDENVVYVNSVEKLMNLGSGNGLINRFAGVVETQDTWKVPMNQEKTVEEFLVEEGQSVEVGTPLLRYDTAKAETDLAQARLDLENLENEKTNLNSQIAELEKQKKKADKDEQLAYQIEIQSAQTNLKSKEYEQRSKEVEIQELQRAIDNAVVTSELAGVVKSITRDSSSQNMYSSEEQALITVIGVGNYRIKCRINEQNMSSVQNGAAVLIYSRVDREKFWKGTMGAVDTQNPGRDDSNSSYYISGDATTQSNSYPFYVDLESAEGLMLGQHVYVEMDNGQSQQKAGVWLEEYYINDLDSDPYVWADNGNGKLEKRSVILGQHDESLMQYEIADGLEKEDLITFPEEGLEEGMKTQKSADGRMGQSNPPGMEEEFPEEGMSPEDGAVPEDMIEDGAVSEDITGDEAIPEDMTGDGTVSEEIPAEESQPEEIPAEGGTADAVPVG
ncbi:MAG TPA: efflux RND transporter periplasmic adaptor subunit [Candidatus Egerieimonas intestinavium]|uniref:Efflux RND transporter periplasmic adaptor subunit n=1 Tax=Candidatus Egerieimonas intestinavium TaxID=2840777 RepID=A0A9D1EHD0_9FIRM|nr:efflux RND transporter periplasmic adaptor subunit [Candidatus Egerieimonas intestinavium]